MLIQYYSLFEIPYRPLCRELSKGVTKLKLCGSHSTNLQVTKHSRTSNDYEVRNTSLSRKTITRKKIKVNSVVTHEIYAQELQSIQNTISQGMIKETIKDSQICGRDAQISCCARLEIIFLTAANYER